MGDCNSRSDSGLPPSASRDVTARRSNPNSTWVCGHSELGFACAQGPTAKGECCNLHSACDKQPSNSSSQPESACSSCSLACHSRTNASGTASGTASPWKECEAAANSPCVPVRSAYSFRNTLAINLAVVTSGLLMCLMFFPQREATFVPGSLSSKHAQILDNKLVSERCSLCHPNSHTNSELTSALATQDELCIRCHASQLPQLHLSSPHDLPRTDLKQLTLDALVPNRTRNALQKERLISFQDTSKVSLANSASQIAIDEALTAKLTSWEMETRCSTCHVEHHGRSHNLQAITDQRCQACHAKQFSSFNEGHPDFKDFPRAQPRSIAFTHQAHSEKHFAKMNETFECSKCHVDSQQRGAVGTVFRTLGFETACARCHEEAINAASVDGWVMLQLPSIRPEDTKATERDLTDWPTSAQFGYEGKVPLAMRSLLMSDEKLNSVLALLPNSGELKAIADFATNGRESTLQLAAGSRSLIREIAAEGQAAWRGRLESVLSGSLNRKLTSREQALVDELCAGLPPDIFRQMEQQWFGNKVDGIATDGSSAQSAASLISFQQDDDLLATTPDDSKQPRAPETADDLLLAAPTNQQALDDAILTTPRKTEKLTKLRGAVHVKEGGWYLDHETLSLRYMPRGHSDRTLAAWSEFATLLAESSGRESLAGQVPGGCTQCHSLRGSVANPIGIESGESIARDHAKSTWRAHSKPATARELTKFDHTPHLTLPALMDCKYCHKLQLSSEKTTSGQLVSTAPSAPAVSVTATCEFKTMHIEQCSACHRPNAASTSCTQCHNYHVTSFNHAFAAPASSDQHYSKSTERLTE